jgi:hypothetical protein
MRESVPFVVRKSWWRSALQPAFVAASVVWAALLLLAPFAASRPHASEVGTALVVVVYGIGSLLCHQLPERSYRAWSAQMPVCARCAGIYLGAAIAAVVAAKTQAPLDGWPTRERGLYGGRRFSSANGARVALLAAAAPTLATLAYEWTTGHMPAHGIRAAAGVPLGAVAAWLVTRHARFDRFAHPSTGAG